MCVAGDGEPTSAPETTELDTSTVQFGVRHRRRPWTYRSPKAGLWTQFFLVTVALLVALTIGVWVVPQGAPQPAKDQGAAPATGEAPSAPPTGVASPSPSPGRPADALADWAASVAEAVQVPVVAMQAYGYAQIVMERTRPGCHLSWTTLAAIGQVESTQGQSGGAELLESGRSVPAIAGPLLDGKGGRPEVKDTDAGAFDGDSRFDRAMGPLHLMPTIWRAQAIDADDDGILDPYDLDDAALALARLLCSGTQDLSNATGWNTAVGRFHGGTTYARSIFTIANDYGLRTRNIG